MTAVKNLVGFDRVELMPGESRALKIKIDEDAFTVVLPDERRVIEPGQFEVMAGHSSKDEDLIKIMVTF